MSKSRRLCIEEILKDLQNLFDQKEDKQVQDLINKNHTEAFRQMCYYQSYLDKKDNTNMMQSEYLKFKGIYLCYKDPKIALLALQKGLLSTKAQKGIIHHFLYNNTTAFFRRKGYFKKKPIRITDNTHNR